MQQRIFHDAFDRASKLKLKQETESKRIDIVSQGFGLLSILEMVDVTGSLSHWFFNVFNIFNASQTKVSCPPGFCQ